MDDGRPTILLGDGQARWRWTRGYVGNVGAAIALAVADARAAGQVYNIGEERPRTEREWVEEIGRAAGWRGTVVTMPDARLPESMRKPLDWSYELALDTSLLRDTLGFQEPFTREEGLQATIRWERSQGESAEPPDYAAEDAAIARASKGSR
jgi:nucleoside-diphosphate-sugar epimerase